ncbi:MAG: hypothetical protein EXX96DRAFT_471532 [Benjaminiella poitrasii]|nr:MAG: hypothetical protein EXX96DRAFT_471532 [Benjaminiella poitrasii]
MNVSDEVTTLHSFSIRPSYTWNPSSKLSRSLELGTPLFTSTPLTDDEHSRIFEQYPAIVNIRY